MDQIDWYFGNSCRLLLKLDTIAVVLIAGLANRISFGDRFY